MPTMKELLNGAVCKGGCKTDCTHFSIEISDCKFRCISQHINKTGSKVIEYTQRNCKTACIMGIGNRDDNYCLFGEREITELRDPNTCEIRKNWTMSWKKVDQQCMAAIEARDSK